MLLARKFCKYETPLTRILKHFPKVFNYPSQTLTIYTYTGIYIKKYLLVNVCYMRVKKLCGRCSVIL